MASPGSDDDGTAAAAAVCCMCGDHGLPRELFRCNLCRLRLQHRYCSELYPREAAYRSCNWCLREKGGGGGNAPVRAPTTAVAKRRPKSSRGRGDMVSPVSGCSMSAFSADPGKPVKKPKESRERAVQRPVETRAAKQRREVQASTGRKAQFRVKVRRYKLLADVTC